MNYTHFTVTQNGKLIGNVADREQAVNAAKGLAAKNKLPVSVVGHREDGKTNEVIYHPNGNVEKKWKHARKTEPRR